MKDYNKGIDVAVEFSIRKEGSQDPAVKNLIPSRMQHVKPLIIQRNDQPQVEMKMVDSLRSKTYIVCLQKAYLLPEIKGRKNEVRVASVYRTSEARYPCIAIFLELKCPQFFDG